MQYRQTYESIIFAADTSHDLRMRSTICLAHHIVTSNKFASFEVTM